jgi:hypothetical protein
MFERGEPLEKNRVNEQVVTTLQQSYTRRAVEVLMTDDRVAAAWMKGSLATGGAGLYSDVDLGVVVYDAHYEAFCRDKRDFLESLGALVGFGQASVGSRVTVALFADPIELDLTIDPLSAEASYGPEMGWILFDKTGGKLEAARKRAEAKWELNTRRAREITTAFWLRAPRMRRWVAKADLHRAGKELQSARDWLVELMLIANDPNQDYSVQKDTFTLLSAHQWEELQSTYILSDFTPQALARCLMRIAYAISIWGRAACARQGSEYPVELERVAAAAVSQFFETMFGPLSERKNGRNKQ